MIDRITTDKIKEAAQIVDVVSDFVTLKRAGANYKGLCPFHDDKTPSFMVSPAKNYCKCFACGKGGNPIGFIMEHEQISYPDALRYLAKKYGIEIREKEMSAEEKAAQTERDSMFILNEWALEWFQQQMYGTPDGRAIGLAYFRQRGFRDDIVKTFQLGFCPKGKDTMTKAALKEGYQEKFLVDTGLSVRRDDGSLYDRYWGRVMFPIHSVGGRVVGFGGRVLDAATKGINVKYQNSPESIIYNKRKELYGLFQAKQAIIKADLCYLVEGYTDVISMHQMGVENVVASSGTALTNDQIRLIHRFTENITVLYDGDAAGIKASQRGIDMLLAQGMNVKLLLLPDDDDPDSFAKKHNAQEYQQYMTEHQVDFIQFKTDLLLKEAHGDPILLSRLIGNIVQSISVIPEEITSTLYIHQAAQTMHMDEDLIKRAVAKQQVKNREEQYRMQNRQGATATEVQQQPSAEELTATATPQSQEGVQPATATPTASAPQSSKKVAGSQQLELYLAQLIVRNGERVIAKAEDENGNKIPLSVIEYLYYSLQEDDIALENPMARFILEEGFLHVKDDNFVAERYFLNHDDQQVAQVAFQLSTDREELSKYFTRDQETTLDEKSLLDLTTHILSDIKLAIIRREIEQVKEDMKKPENSGRMMELLAEFKEKKEIEAVLGKQCGDRVVK